MPDIIVHKRGCNEDNLIVIEAKRNATPKVKEEDEEKLK